MKIDDAQECLIYNNTWLNNSNGLWISHSDNNIVRDNTFQYCGGMQIITSGSNEVFNNTFEMCGYGFWLRRSTYNYIHNNSMDNCGIIFQAPLLEYWNHYVIDTTNTVNNKPIYYWKNQTNGVIPPNAGQIILANCTNIKVIDQNSSCGIQLAFSSNCIIKNTICGFNYWYNIYLFNSNNNLFFNLTCYDDKFWDRRNYSLGWCYLEYSSFNVFDNCTGLIKPPFMIYLESESKNNIAINCTFNSTICGYDDTNSNLLVYNYLHIQVIDQRNISIKNADVKIINENNTIYSTPGYGGKNSKTNKYGQLKWILVPYKYFHANKAEVFYETELSVKFNNSKPLDNDRIINMSTSHFEFFKININYLPFKVSLKSPDNYIFINDSTPDFIWNPAIDEDNDSLTYIIRLKRKNDNWNNLITNNHTKVEVLNWTIPYPLSDETYQWQVCANDSYGNGIWSDIWEFTIDTKPPSSYISLPQYNKFSFPFG